jgi:hypothetical protein
MNRFEHIKLSHSVIEWLSHEIIEVENIIKKLKNPEMLTQEDKELYHFDDLDYLENKLNELNQRSVFEAKNLKKLRIR